MNETIYPVFVEPFKNEPAQWIVLRIVKIMNGSLVTKRMASILFRTDDIENGKQECLRFIQSFR